jgi:hypothetical protein
MKTAKKIIGKLAVGCVLACCLSQFTSQTFAIEGLKVSVQSTNAVLFWPSDPSETYIVQYRPTLTADSSWTTLTNYYPAAMDANVTFFVHSNIVQYPLVVGGGTNGGNISPMTSSSSTSSSVPMTMPANGSGSAVPLMLYPPGFDLSGFDIFDPVTGDWVSGAGLFGQPGIQCPNRGY